MSDQSRQYATMRSALRLIAAMSSGRLRAAEKIVLTAPNTGELALGLANLLIRVLATYRVDPTEFIERGLADIARVERAEAAQQQGREVMK